jgi:hypothetical protein
MSKQEIKLTADERVVGFKCSFTKESKKMLNFQLIIGRLV